MQLPGCASARQHEASGRFAHARERHRVDDDSIGDAASPHFVKISRWWGETLSSRRIQRSEEHTSELQSLTNLVCRLLLEKKKKKITKNPQTKHVTTNVTSNRHD